MTTQIPQPKFRYQNEANRLWHALSRFQYQYSLEKDGAKDQFLYGDFKEGKRIFDETIGYISQDIPGNTWSMLRGDSTKLRLHLGNVYARILEDKTPEEKELAELEKVLLDVLVA